jgi:predicted DNA binding CopG/RHH family protein
MAHLVRLAREAEEKALRAVSMRIPAGDLNRARKIAVEEGIGYQAVLKRAIHEGIGIGEKALKQAAASGRKEKRDGD